MHVHVPMIESNVYKDLHTRKNPEKFDPLLKTYLGILYKNLKSLKSVAYKSIDSIHKYKDDFLRHVTPLDKCPERPMVHIDEVDDNECIEKTKMFCETDDNCKICDVTQLSVPSSYKQALDDDTIFRIGDSCFANTISTKSNICPVFSPFLPPSSKTVPFIAVLKKDCFYDIKTDSGSFFVYATTIAPDETYNIHLKVIETLSDEYSKFDGEPRAFNGDLSQINFDDDAEINIYDVNDYRGPCILQDIFNLRSNNSKCVVDYNTLKLEKKENPYAFMNKSDLIGKSVFEIESTLLPADCPSDKCWAFKLDETTWTLIPDTDGEEEEEAANIIKIVSDQFMGYKLFENRLVFEDTYASDVDGIKMRCGIGAYMRGHVGLSKNFVKIHRELFLHELDVLKGESSTRDASKPTASNLYYRSLHPEDDMNEDMTKDLEVLQYGKDHEIDGLATLQRLLQMKNTDYKVVSNTNFYYDDTLKIGGTPDGFVIDSADNVIGVVEIKCHMSTRTRLETRIPFRVRVQAAIHQSIMKNKTGAADITSYIVFWNANESRIFETEDSLVANIDSEIPKILESIEDGVPYENWDETETESKVYTLNSCEVLSSTKEFSCDDLSLSSANKQNVRLLNENEDFVRLEYGKQQSATFSKLPFSLLQKYFKDLTDTSMIQVFTKLREKGFELLSMSFEDITGNGNSYILGQEETKDDEEDVLEISDSMTVNDENNFRIFAPPLFKDQEEFDQWIAESEDIDVLDKKYKVYKNADYVEIYKDGEIYCCPITDNSITEGEIQKNTDVFQLSSGDGGDVKVQVKVQNCVILEDGFLVHFFDAESQLKEHIQGEQKYDLKYWVKLFYLLSLQRQDHLKLSFSKTKVLDKSNVVSKIVRAFNLNKNKFKYLSTFMESVTPENVKILQSIIRNVDIQIEDSIVLQRLKQSN